MKRILLCSIILIFLYSGLTAKEKTNYRFDQLANTRGQTQNTILCMHRDSHGFLWIGSYEGLCRFDGYHFKTYKNDPSNPQSINSNRIRVIVEDRKGRLWLGTDGGGVNCYDPEMENFIHYIHNPDDPNSISNNRVNNIIVDKNEELWIATDFGGLDRFNPETEEFTHYKNDPQNSSTISHDIVTSLVEEKNGTLWIATFSGLNLFDRTTEKFHHFLLDPRHNDQYAMNSIRCFIVDKKGFFWLGTFENGIARFDSKTGKIKIYQHNEYDPHSLSSNITTALHEDRYGRIWVGTQDGLNLFEEETERFVHYRHNPYNLYSIGGNIINAIEEDPEDMGDALWIGGDGIGLNRIQLESKPFEMYRQDVLKLNTLSASSIMSIFEDPEKPGQILWLGTKGGGVNRFDRIHNTYTHFKHNPKRINSLSNDVVRTIVKDRNGILWFGTESGITTYNEQTGKFKRYTVEQDNPYSLKAYSVFTIYKDSYDILWIGGWDMALARYDEKIDGFIPYLPDDRNPNSINCRIVWYVYEDPFLDEKILWIGTHNGGLNRFNPETETFQHFVHDPNNPESICHNTVMSIHKADEENCLWIATAGGLEKFNTKTEIFTHYKDLDLSNRYAIQSLLIDSHENLWMGTMDGIVKFDIQNQEYIKYRKTDGLQGKDFNTNAAYMLASGEMIFGGYNGFNIFHPDSIKRDTRSPNVVITDFQIFNQSVSISTKNDAILRKSITQIDEITLSYKENVFSFEFAALHLTAPDENQYAYRLTGFEKEWNYRDATKRFATYTNLNPGEYTFEVKAANSDGIWADMPTVCKVIIAPPYWRTTWFRISIAFLIVSTTFTFFNIRTRSMIKRNQELEMMNLKLNRGIEEKQVLLKEVHHRVKNNLQVICSLLHLESHQIDKNNYMRAFQETENRIHSMALVHQKLYQSETLSEIDIKGYVKDLVQNLRNVYRGHSYDLHVDIENDNIHILIDQAVPLGLVINELVSNAIEHAYPENYQEKEKITIVFKELSDTEYQLIVEDNGIGLPESLEIDKQKSLGLKLISLLIEDQLDGTIDIIRKNGTRFIISFPKILPNS